MERPEAKDLGCRGQGPGVPRPRAWGAQPKGLGFSGLLLFYFYFILLCWTTLSLPNPSLPLARGPLSLPSPACSLIIFIFCFLFFLFCSWSESLPLISCSPSHCIFVCFSLFSLSPLPCSLSPPSIRHFTFALFFIFYFLFCFSHLIWFQS
ncbi:hypothetical protein M758_N026700 [Ceratodon purpureus]|nr:hypothetical protein M758_N028700 [Ceratodon purpureus]KAG0504683.1 hypothetical protein M758_N026700 [Ceratodon purpureus]